jgi:hypothetical protein
MRLCRDVAAEKDTVDKQGMDGFLGVLQAAFTGDGSAAAATEEIAADDGAKEQAATARARRSEALLEQKMQNMDKYERRRFEIEQATRQGQQPATVVPPAVSASREGGAMEADTARAVHVSGTAKTAGGDQLDSDQPEVTTSRKRRADDDKIAAARARALARKQHRSAA